MSNISFRNGAGRAVTAVLVAAVAAAAGAPVLAQQGATTSTSAAASAPGQILALSMEQAVTMALETSLGLKSERLSVDIASQSIVSARAAFLPFVSSGFSRNTAQSAAQQLPDGTSVVPSRSSVSANGALSQNLAWYGGRYSLQWSGNRSSSAGSGSTFNPALGSTFAVSFAQPLWQDFSIDQNRAGLQRSERLRVIADLDLQQRVVATEATVRGAYLGLIAAIEGRKVAQQNMDVAEQSLRNSRARVAVGQSPQIDIITTEASVETFRDSLLQADANIGTREDMLRSLILDPARTDYWEVHLSPTDTIEVTPREIDEPAAIRAALANRLDMVSLKRSMEITDLNLSVAQNATRPSLDLNVNYAASGSGGTQLLNGAASVRGFGTVLGDAFGGAYPSWTFGATFGYPLGRSSAQASLAQGQIQKQQQQLQLRQLELDIVGDVRDAARSVRSSLQRVQATRAALAANVRQLDAEERRLAVGLTDTFAVQQRQLSLATARISELNAMIAYNNALIQFDRVQKVR
jgi:outer membrane protein TolC